MNARSLFLLVFALSLTACSQPTETYDRTLYTFGTLATVQIYDLPRDEAIEIADQIELRLSVLNRDWYAWGDGELGQLNRTLADAEQAPVSDLLGSLIKRSLELRDLSGGRFDPAVGSLVELWGFHDSKTTPVRKPADQDIRSDGSTLGVSVTGENGSQIVVTGRTGIVIDLGGIAKGAALAECARLLRAAGARRALVNLGGDLIALTEEGGPEFRIGIQNPRAEDIAGLILASDGEAVVSSGDYERFFDSDEQRFHHIIDPETGYPSAGAVAVTVIDKDPLLADAAATALMVAGPDAFYLVSKDLGIENAALIDQSGTLYLTDAMQARLVDARARGDEAVLP